MRKRTVSLIVILIFFLSVGYTLRGPIVSTCIQYYFKGYCRVCLGGKFTYETARHENGIWTFKHPAITTKKSLDLGGYRLDAECATIDAKILWSSRTIDIGISLVNPELHIGNGADELKRILGSPPGNYDLVYVNTHFNVPSGQIIVHRKDHSEPLNMSFDLDTSFRETISGSASLFLGKENVGTPDLLLTLNEYNGVDKEVFKRLKFEFRDFQGSHFGELVKEIFPDYLAGVLSKGRIDGTIDLTIPLDSPPFAEGRLSARNVELNYPSIECRIDIPELTLDLAHKNIDDTHLIKNIHMIGDITIHEGVKVSFNNQGVPLWTIEGNKGEIAFHSHQKSRFKWDGQIIENDRHRYFEASGEGRFEEKGQNALSLSLGIQALGDKPDVNIDFSARELGENWHFAEACLTGIGKSEFNFIKSLILKDYPAIAPIEIQDGTVDLSFLAYIQDYKLMGVEAPQIAAHHLKLKDLSTGFDAAAQDAFGKFSLDLASNNPLGSLNADLNIAGGLFNLVDGEQNKYGLHDMSAELKVQQGVLQNSSIQGNIAGLIGTIRLDGREGNGLASLDFIGSFDDISSHLSEEIGAVMKASLKGHELHIQAVASKENDDILFKGSFNILSQGEKELVIPFGFGLDFNTKRLLENSPISFAPLTIMAIALPKTLGISQSLLQPTEIVQHTTDKLKESVKSFIIHDGFFTADHIDLEKYLSPFIFLRDEMHIQGLCDLKGIFNEMGCVIRYDGQDLVLENEFLNLNVKSISEGDSSPDRFKGVYVIDFINGTAESILPVRNGIYFEKNSGLLFTDISTTIRLEKGHAYLTGLETYCNGVCFSEGTIHADWSSPGDGIFNVEIASPKMHGKVSQIQDIFSHFPKPIFLAKLPMDGRIDFHEKGGFLSLAFQPDDYQFTSYAQGGITDAYLTCQIADIQVQEIAMNFNYDHEANTLDFNDIQGTLLVGSSDQMEEYGISGDTLRFTDYENNEVEFDVWVGDKKRNILRLAGRTQNVLDDLGSSYIDFQLNKELSHFGDAHPAIFQFSVYDWSLIHQFHLEFDFHLNSLLHDLQRLSRTGLFSFSKSILKQLNGIKHADGDFKALFNYDSTSALFSYDIRGKGVGARHYKFDEFIFSGKKKGSTWTVDQLQIDNMSLALDLRRDENIWNIQFLGARFGKSLLLGVEGRYDMDQTVLDAKINLLQVNLGHLNEWNPIKEIVEDARLGGELHASGDLQIKFDKELPSGMSVEMHALGSLVQGKFKGLDFDDVPNMTFKYLSDSGISLKEVSTSIKSAKQGTKQAGIHLNDLSFDFVKQAFLLDGLAFTIPALNLSWLVDNLQQSFPSIFTPSLADMIRSSKPLGELSGRLDMSLNESGPFMTLALNNDTYRFMDTDINLNDFVLSYDSSAIDLSARYKHEELDLAIRLHSASPTFSFGDLAISEIKEDKNVLSYPQSMIINWQVNPFYGYDIQRISGSLCGLSCDLVAEKRFDDEKDYYAFTGRIDPDFTQAKALMKPDVAAVVKELGIGGGYTFDGTWKLSRDDTKPLIDRLTFNGNLYGSEFSLLGYRFSSLTSEIHHTPDATSITHFQMIDPCGIMTIEQFQSLRLDASSRQVETPLIKLINYRPSLMRSLSGISPYQSRTLAINHLEVQDLKGKVGDRTTFTGTGALTFVNPPKENLNHTIFAIPAEILTRIGLDLDVLTPVKGHIEYEIRDGKVYLKKFKDVYSKKKVSKFNLANNGYDSYIDFDGNLHLQVKMKQYNIIFKLAELFSVTIQGTLQKPTYSLQKANIKP